VPNYIQIGITALRDPATGGFLPAVPLYIEATESATLAEQVMTKDIARVFAARMKQYIDGSGFPDLNRSGKEKKKSRNQNIAMVVDPNAEQNTTATDNYIESLIRRETMKNKP